MDTTKRDLFRAIRNHCKACFGKNPDGCHNRACELNPYRSVTIGVQTDIFRVEDKEIFIERVLAAALGFGRSEFFWSDLRSAVDLRPLHDNWWGCSTRRLHKHGFRVLEGVKKSTHKSRAGGIDRKWKKVF